MNKCSATRLLVGRGIHEISTQSCRVIFALTLPHYTKIPVKARILLLYCNITELAVLLAHSKNNLSNLKILQNKKLLQAHGKLKNKKESLQGKIAMVHFIQTPTSQLFAVLLMGWTHLA